MRLTQQQFEAHLWGADDSHWGDILAVSIILGENRQRRNWAKP